LAPSCLSGFNSCSDDYDDAENLLVVIDDGRHDSEGDSDGALFACPRCGCLLDEGLRFSFSTGYPLYGKTPINNSMCIVRRYYYQYCINPYCYYGDINRKIVDRDLVSGRIGPSQSHASYKKHCQF
jgi:hypothetical protein